MTAPLVRLESEADLEAPLQAPLAVVFKHSTRCGLSASALIEVRQFAACHPTIPVYLLDVIADRALARHVAQRLGVRHESPQAIVLAHGRVRWHGSHSRVSAAAMEDVVSGTEHPAGQSPDPVANGSFPGHA